MTSARSALRLGALLLAFLTLFVPFGVGARAGVDCDDFGSPGAAQVLLDADDSYENALDADGDGVACNGDDDQAGDPATLDHAARGAAYIDAIWNEVDRIADSIDHFTESVNDPDGAHTDDEVEEVHTIITETSAMWLAYPETAPSFDPPAEYAPIDELYQTWVASVGESGEAWEVFWNIPSGDPGEEAALDDFNEAIGITQDYEHELMRLLSEAEADLPLEDDATRSDDEEAAREDDDEPTDEDEPAASDSAAVAD